MNAWRDRIVRAAKLDANLYEEVEADRTAMTQAMGVVLLASAAAGLGSGSFSLGRIVMGSLAALVSWGFWGVITYVVGAKLLPEPQTRADVGELLRTIGFASAPGIIRIAGIIPPLRSIVFFAAAIWMFAAMVVAVRQALDYRSTLRAFGVCLLGGLVHGLLLQLFLGR
ncbi:MAG: YIP1 family protein [Candidatus Latescibacterota bacterium]|nr:MAG: YIP1 family protein [Candidatus Latescibacterota bacterium]